MPEYDVFVSYAHADAAAVEPLTAALRDHGLEVWQDASDIAPFASITQRIEDGLERSKAVLAFYSSTYPTRRACQWELTAGLVAAQQDGDVRARVLVVNPEDGAGHVHPVELRDQLFVTGGDLADAAAVAGRIADHVATLDGPLGEIRALQRPRWHGAVASASAGFTGRQADLWRVHSALAGPDVPIITGRSSAEGSAVISGLGGMGKSMLAAEYALRFGAAYPGGVFWLRAFGNDDAKAALDATQREAERQSQMLGFAAELGMAVEGLTPDQVDGAVFAVLDERAERCLWVVDDLPADLDATGFGAWACRAVTGRTLYTTRSRQYGDLAELVDLGVLDDDSAFDLLTSRRQPDGQEEIEAARGMVATLGAHPLGLAVSAQALAELAGMQTFAEYRESLDQPGTEALDLAAQLTGVLPTGHGTSIVQTMLTSIQRLDEPAFDFLLLASVLAAAPIPPKLVAATLAAADELAPAAATARAVTAMHQAGERSLADAPDEGGRSVHTLVSRAVQAVAPDRAPGRSDVLRTAVVAVVTDLMPAAADVREHAEVEPILPHARALARPLATEEEAGLLSWLARYEYERGAYAVAEADFRTYVEASRRLLGDEHPVTLQAMNSLAESLRGQGDYEAARAVHEQVLEASMRVLGVGHHDTIASMNNLGLVRQELGDLEGAAELFSKAFEAGQEALGPTHPFTINPMHNMAILLRQTGDLAGSAEILQVVAEARTAELGPDHPDTLGALNSLGETARAMGDHATAGRLHRQVLEARQRMLGDEHPDTVTSMNNLGLALMEGGDPAGAQELFAAVVATCRRTLGDHHPFTLKATRSLAGALHRQGDLEKAHGLLNDLLGVCVEAVGAEHAITLGVAEDMAGVLHDAGEAAAARRLFEQVLEAKRRSLGDDHPSTLISTSNLAALAKGAGDLAAARDGFAAALAGMRRAFGDQHPSTYTMARRLMMTLVDAGDPDAAQAVVRELPQAFVGWSAADGA